MRELGQVYDRVVCASRDLCDRLARGGVANTTLQPMGVDTALFHPARRDPAVRRRLLAHCELPESAHLLIGVGRYCAEKRRPVLIDAVMRASLTKPIGLLLFGEGGARGRLAKHIAGNPHIHLIAPERDRSRFATIVASADGLVHASASETFGMAPAEARDGGGLNYRAGDALSAADAILELLAHPPRRRADAAGSMHDHFTRLFSDCQRIVDGERRVA
jgi:alpha-1,6-mannosyltransferase